MAARPPVWAPLVGIAAAGLALAWVARTLAAEVDKKTFFQGKFQFWNPDQREVLKQKLSQSHVMPLGVERTWKIMPGTMAGQKNALQQVLEIQTQAGGGVVATDLDLTWMAALTVDEFGASTAQTGPDIAILPAMG